MAISNFFKKNKILLIILLLASVLRFWDLQGIPPHLRNDEAALGYNAYSILKTGSDEHGQFLPIIFQSFGDWKTGLYIYLTIPFVAMLGLNELAIRLPSALSGIAAVLAIYGVAVELFNKKRVAYFASFLLAISPLFVPFSRGAWEVNVSFFLTLAGIYFFLIAMKKYPKALFFSAIFFGLSLFTSHGAKFSTPVIITILILIFNKQFRKIRKSVILSSLAVIFIFAIPVMLSFSQGKVARLTTLSIFSYSNHQGWYSETGFFTRSILSRWLSLYNPSLLFIKGDLNPQHDAPNTGPFLLIDALFLFAGFIKLVRSSFSKQTLFIWSSLFLLALPSALTIEKANLERILTMFIPLLLIEALGLDWLWENVRNKYKSVILIVIIFSLLYITNYVYFLDQYFIHGPKKNDAWQYGYKQIVQKITPIQSKYSQIIVQQSYEHPYIFFLFYQQYDPQKYQKNVDKVFTPNQEGKDMGLVSGIDNIIFSNIDWKVSKPTKNTLFVMPVYKLDQESKFYSSYRILDEIKDLNSFPLFEIIQTL